MENKTVIERLKEDEENINIKAKIRGFMVEITDDFNNNGSITIWKFNKNTKTLNQLETFIETRTFVETLNIEGVASFQVTIKKDNEILEHGLYLDTITQWIYNRLNSVNIEFMYQFFGGKYNGQTMTREEIESISSGTTEDLTYIRQQSGTCHRKELDNQPLVDGYLSPMFSHIDYGLVYLRYETQEVYNMMSI
jgi:hypothetical protein